MDLIMGPLESFLEEAFKPIENRLSSLLPYKNYVKYLLLDVEYLVAITDLFSLIPPTCPNLGKVVGTYE